MCLVAKGHALIVHTWMSFLSSTPRKPFTVNSFEDLQLLLAAVEHKAFLCNCCSSKEKAECDQMKKATDKSTETYNQCWKYCLNK